MTSEQCYFPTLIKAIASITLNILMQVLTLSTSFAITSDGNFSIRYVNHDEAVHKITKDEQEFLNNLLYESVPFKNQSDVVDNKKRFLSSAFILMILHDPHTNSRMRSIGGLYVTNAVITGELTIANIDSNLAISFVSCTFSSNFTIRNSKLSYIYLSRSSFNEINVENVKCNEDIVVTNNMFSNSLQIRNTESHGIYIDASTLSGETHALYIEDVKVNSLTIRNSKSKTGCLTIHRTHVSKDFNIANCNFTNKTGDVVNFFSIEVGGLHAISDTKFRGKHITSNCNFKSGFQFVSVIFSQAKKDVTGALPSFVFFRTKAEQGSLFKNVNFEGHTVFFTDTHISGYLGFYDCKFNPSNGDSVVASGIVVTGLILFKGCISNNGALDLSNASIGGLSLYSSTFGHTKIQEGASGVAINLSQVQSSSSIRLSSNSIINGEIHLDSAKIKGKLIVSGSTINNINGYSIFADSIHAEEGVIIDDGSYLYGDTNFSFAKIAFFESRSSTYTHPQGTALSLSNSIVQSDIYIGEGAVIYGQLQLDSVSCLSNVVLYGVNISNPYGNSVSATNISANKSLHITGHSHVVGDISIIRANIGDFIIFENTTFDSNLIAISLCSIGQGLVFKNNFLTLDPVINLSYTKTRLLDDEIDSWPPASCLLLDGFFYEMITSLHNNSFEQRAKWLAKSKSFTMYPYVILSEAYKRAGLDNDASSISIEKINQALEHESVSRSDALLFWFSRVFLDYGYNPFKILYGLLFIPIGGFVFYNAHVKGLIVLKSEFQNKQHHLSGFNAFLYSFDLFLPIINLFYKDNWARKSCYNSPVYSKLFNLYFCLHIFSGWIITSYFVLGLSGLIKK